MSAERLVGDLCGGRDSRMVVVLIAEEAVDLDGEERNGQGVASRSFLLPLDYGRRVAVFCNDRRITSSRTQFAVITAFYSFG